MDAIDEIRVLELIAMYLGKIDPNIPVETFQNIDIKRYNLIRASMELDPVALKSQPEIID